MYESPFRKGLPWLIAGLLFLLVSTVLYLYDFNLSDKELLSRVESKLNEDFKECIDAFNNDSPRSDADLSYCHFCRLNYSRLGRLSSWENKEYLPTQKSISKLSDISKEDRIFKVNNRTYYQVRKEYKDSTSIILIPIRITYEVSNNYLIPFVFLGRSEDVLNGDQKYLNDLQISIEPPYSDSEDPYIPDMVLTGEQGDTILYYSGVPIIPFRTGIRYMVLACLVIGGILLAIFLRMYALQKWEYRYFIDISLFIGIIAIRKIMLNTGIPGKYIEGKLFSPNILAFHEYAPSLGELTINIFTFAILAWIAYMYFFRMSNILLRKITKNQYIAWPSMFLTIGISSYLLGKYVSIFRAISINSQVNLSFSNFVNADIYSFVILLDVGVLLLALGLIIFSLLKLNVLYARRYGNSAYFISFHILATLICNFILHDEQTTLAIINSVVVLMLGFCVYRIPFQPILHQDLLNYLIITSVFSILATYNLVVGTELSNEVNAQQIGETILNRQTEEAVVNFNEVIKKIQNNASEIKAKQTEITDYNQYEDWLKETYIQPEFKRFEINTFLYYKNKRLDTALINESISYGPDASFSVKDIGGKITDNFFELPNDESKYLDIYVGTFNIGSFLGDSILVLAQLLPNTKEREGLYLPLSLDQGAYEDVRIVQSFDHGIYRDSLLYYQKSKTSFPVLLESYDGEQSFTIDKGDYSEVKSPIGKGNKIVVVHLPKQGFLDIITTFSFVFYFYILATILLIGFPVLILRTLRSGKFSYQIPLRSKIRIGLFSISILPLILIMISLSFFIRDRYNEEAKKELIEEAVRIKQIIERDYRNLHNDPFSRITLFRDFQQTIYDLEPVLLNDINIFDEYGKKVASTQSLLFNAGISSDLMNEIAFDSLKHGGLADLVITEHVGNLEYFSSYLPIIGNNNTPIGYLNIPYLAKQDQLDEQITDFLAYLANIYLLIFLFINVVAVLVSSTITQPLTMIQHRLASISLANINEPITYEAKDEIGAIVTAYNQMVSQLAESQERLSQSQREMAWRQMARQVAHEIKNPLTPMKLSIQHLSRAWNENTPRLKTMFPKVMKTLLVQIDSMVRIANSFSEFAKMPEPVKSRVLVNEVLVEVVDLYTQSEEAIWLIDVPQADFWAYADRDQLSRCFNNIVKNGLQAIEDNGIIHISMRILEGECRIEIKDNGAGIPPEVQKRIFEPSFSTKTSGMGLGLAIVKRIIENTGGTINFESKEGKGTTFYIEIPSADEDIDFG